MSAELLHALIYENKPWSACWGCCTANPGEMSGKQRHCSFFEISYFCSFCSSERGVKGGWGGIWGDLACRRVIAGAVGSALDVRDGSVTTIGVMERNSLREPEGLCRVAVIVESI